MKASKQDTKEKILDAAEKLFARNGFHAASLRAITGEAGVNLASVNYHFGSKDALLDAVFERRLSPLNEIRIQRIEAVREAAGKKGVHPSVRETIRAFIEPTLALREEGAGAGEFIALVGRIFSEPTETARTIFMRRMEPLFQLLFTTLKEALPDMAEDLLFWKLQFTIGVLSHVLRMTGRGPALSTEVSRNCDTKTLTEWMVTFLTAGMEAP
ncbi:MAG: TetR/AcrR family transcriptional regulator [Deltaproteobacteria bacterium]|nr:TetR/AcrR family transcriptional regulator [Deltaproteobacteria bacterium]